MNLLKLRTIAQLRDFVQGTQAEWFEALAATSTRHRHVDRSNAA